MHLQILKSMILLANFFEFINCFSNSLRMSSTSDNYLRSLSITPNPVGTYHNDLTFKKVMILPNNIKETNQTDVEIDTILLNIYRVENVFFNKNSKTIMLKLRDTMKDIYVYNDDIMKLANDTKIVSKSFKNLVVYPMQLDADAVMYKSEST